MSSPRRQCSARSGYTFPVSTTHFVASTTSLFQTPGIGNGGGGGGGQAIGLSIVVLWFIDEIMPRNGKQLVAYAK